MSLNFAVRSDPSNDAARLARAEVERRLEDFEAALSDFDVYLAHHQSPNLRRLEIDAARAAQNHQAALASIDAYLAIEPDDLEIVQARGDELYAVGRETDAIEAWKAYADRAPDDVEVLKRIAYASEHAADFPGAVAALTAYVRKQPGDDRLRLALAYDQARAGHPELATAEFTTLQHSADPDVSAKAAAELRARMADRARSSRVGYGTLEYDSRFHDIVFGADVYALGPAGRFTPYLSIHSWDDTRSSARGYEPVI
jgi:tetratricopeptide (TPR) repeat protein